MRRHLHWWVLVALTLGVAVGWVVQATTEAPGWIGARIADDPGGGVLVEEVQEDLLPAVEGFSRERLRAGDRLEALVLDQGIPDLERVIPLPDAAALEAQLAEIGPGPVVSLKLADRDVHRKVPLALDPSSRRQQVLSVFIFPADIFMRLLKLLIVPLVLTSIVTGIAGLGGGRDFGRLGGKTLAYYVSTSFLAALLGLTLVSLIQPGEGARLGLSPSTEFTEHKENLLDIFRRMVPENIFNAFSDNGAMLQVIFFAILFGFFLGRAAPEHRKPVLAFFQGAFHVIMKLAEFVLLLVPFGVFFLMVKVVGSTGFGVFKPLLLFMGTVFLALILHAGVTLPLLLRLVGGVSPGRWFRAMTPALTTAFSTSSSSMTLPVTLETLEERGKVSNRTTSFIAPLGATVNMDGTALYECIGVVFLAQYYASAGGYALGLGELVLVVVAAFLASVGAAGIPSAGLVMMLTILSSLQLPLEGAALLLAVDRPLDMCRTVVNVWSDTCGAAILGSSEGEQVTGGRVPALPGMDAGPGG